jgi:N-acetylmuramic acid 6-phosphate etherase
MIQLGRVHEGLMVDVQAMNAKLIERGENILRRLSGRSSEEVHDTLQRAGGNIKVAMLLMHGCDANEAVALLSRAGGRLRTALKFVGDTDRSVSPIDNILSAEPDKLGNK